MEEIILCYMLRSASDKFLKIFMGDSSFYWLLSPWEILRYFYPYDHVKGERKTAYTRFILQGKSNARMLKSVDSPQGFIY